MFYGGEKASAPCGGNQCQKQNAFGSKYLQHSPARHPQVAISAGFFCGISIALGETHEKERRINAINLLTSGEIRPGDQSLRDQNRSVESGTLAITQPYLGKNLRAKSWWAITYPASLLAFLVLATLAWTQCDFSGRGIPDWKPVLALGDAAQEKGDLYYAKSLYCKGEGSRSGATIGQAYSPPPAASGSWKEKKVLIPLQMRFFFARWSQPRRGKVDQGSLR